MEPAVLPIQVAAVVQRTRQLDWEEERARLADTSRRLRPSWRHQLGRALIRLGTRLDRDTARAEPQH
jgi:hypothetical protein